MLQSKKFIRRLGVVLALAALLGGAVIQAQTLPKPEIQGYNENDFPSKASILWYEVPGASRYEVFIRGKGDWKLSRKGGKGGWYPADNDTWHQFYDLMPGDSYNLRVRAVDAQGNVSKHSEKVRITKSPCWVWERYWATGVRWIEKHTADPFTPPPEWEGIEDVIGCGQ